MIYNIKFLDHKNLLWHSDINNSSVDMQKNLTDGGSLVGLV